jgi:multiple sugar transport system ATP-binding protein
VTTLYVTHDQVEAMTLGDRVAVLRDGLLQQLDAPAELYRRPANLFVAEFIGSPAMNLVGADLRRANGTMFAEFGAHRLRIDERVQRALEPFEHKRVILGIRPEDIEDAELVAGEAADRSLSAVVDIREDMGSEVFIHFGVGGPPVRGEDVKAAVGADSIEATQRPVKEVGSLFVARLSRSTRAREGERVELVVNTEQLRFFDTETGLGIYADGATSS